MTAIAKLKRELNKVWESNNLLAYSIPCTQPLMDILGGEFNQGYLVGLALFLYWQNLHDYDDVELEKYIKEIASLSKHNSFKQIYARM
ncbi:MAG: hypothetical protein RBT65_12580 [Methanolobus sp.]|nr:hypothetical protein [Methanolobus sp.]